MCILCGSVYGMAAVIMTSARKPAVQHILACTAALTGAAPGASQPDQTMAGTIMKK